ncbi:U4/U5/U6 small nuclear ribonucleoprotein prp3 [Coemansia sp. RSA 2131]|nr:U4/U5/U6 small nuclear ribonucleoprotein prp3 [Coemansia sp. RSA 2131]
MARIANLNLPSSNSHRPQPPSTAARPAAARPAAARPAAAMPTSARPPPPVATATPTPASIQSTIAAARARIEAQLKSQGIQPNTPSHPTELHPMLRGDYKPNKHSTQRATLPVSSIKANQQKPKLLKITHEAPSSLTDPAQNPYFDPSLTRRTHGPQTRRRHKQFHFVAPGQYVEQAERKRAETRMEQLKQEIAERAELARLEDEVLDASAIQLPEPPQVEWWDAPFLSEASYGSDAKIEGPESLCTIYIQHPVPIEPPLAIRSQGVAPAQLILTHKERKKIRRQRRLEQQRERREKVMLGLLPPEPPKLKMSNFMQIMANESVPDPTKLEAEVRRQMQARQNKHEADNQARKLTKEQRHEKIEAKTKADEEASLVRAVFRINKLEHPRHWHKVSVNAQQMHLTGKAISCPVGFSLVVVEGSAKNVKAYKKLMLRRIDWTMSQLDADQGATDDYTGNECHLIWQGEIDHRKFKQFRQHTCPTETQAKKWLARAKSDELWQLAKQYDPNDSITALDPFA